MEQTQSLLDSEGEASEDYIYLDQKVKKYLTNVWMERNRWIARRFEERRMERERKEEDKRRREGVLPWLEAENLKNYNNSNM